MSDADKQKRKSTGGGMRTKLLAVLLGVVGLAAVWLSDCIPGFGLGSPGVEGDADQAEAVEPAAPAEPEVAEPELEPAVDRKPMPMKLTIDARGCLVDGGEPQDCAALCEQDDLFTDIDAVSIDAKDGPQGTVVEVLDCLKAKDVAVSINHK